MRSAMFTDLSLPRAPVVIADDQGLYRDVLCRYLQRQGHQVVACADWQTAAGAFRRLLGEGTAPGMVVDLIQPGEGGGHLGGLDLLRQLKPGPGGPVVAVMESRAGWLEQAARSLGALRVVRKPDLFDVEPEHLDHALQQFAAEVAGDRAAVGDPLAAGRPVTAAKATVPQPRQASPSQEGYLLGALEELRRSGDRLSLLLLLLRCAAEVADEGVLLEVAGDHLQVLGRFGPVPAGADDTLPLDADSLAARAFWSARLQRSPAKEKSPTADNVSEAGCESMALPVLGPDGVVAVVCGHARSEGGLGDLRPLTALAGMASLALASLQNSPV